MECVAVEPKKLLWVFKARGSVLIWDRLAKSKVIFVHLRKTLPYKLSICFRFAVALCFLASLRRRWHYNVVICCFGTDPFYPGVTSTPSKYRDAPIQKSPVVLQNSRYFDYIIHQSLMYMYPNSEKLVFHTLHYFFDYITTLLALFLVCNHVTSRPRWGSKQKNISSKNLHENRV